MDEAVAGHATRIVVELEENGYLTVSDNGRGIPVDPHPKYPKKSALEVILTELHSGGKFSNKAYETSGGLHGVGVSVVNALSDDLTVEVARNKELFSMSFSRGKPLGKIKKLGAINNRRGTKVRFHPDPEIFGPKAHFKAARLFRMTRAKAYLQPGVEIRWKCAPSLVQELDIIPHEAVFHFPGGLGDFLTETLGNKATVTTEIFAGRSKKDSGHGRVEWAIFISDPDFVGQTKDRLSSSEATKLVENAVRDPFDHWLASSPKDATKLMDWAIERADERVKRRKARDVKRKSATKKLRLPGKLADCSRKGSEDTELFIVEGDSAGGSAKQARNRETQAILPLKGKILNVESATMDKIQRNAEISDLCTALGVGLGKKFDLDDLRYERVIIMTDADVDGAHIAALLITFFYRYTPGLIDQGRLYMAMPPLYKLTQGSKIAYAIDDAHKEELLANEFSGRGKVELGRFKGLGEMMASQLKDTTMNPKTRRMARITIDEDNLPSTEALVETLMGKRADLRYQFIQDHAQFIEEIDV